jgi:hypothetical protein
MEAPPEISVHPAGQVLQVDLQLGNPAAENFKLLSQLSSDQWQALDEPPHLLPAELVSVGMAPNMPERQGE